MWCCVASCVAPCPQEPTSTGTTDEFGKRLQSTQMLIMAMDDEEMDRSTIVQRVTIVAGMFVNEIKDGEAMVDLEVPIKSASTVSIELASNVGTSL